MKKKTNNGEKRGLLRWVLLLRCEFCVMLCCVGLNFWEAAEGRRRPVVRLSKCELCELCRVVQSCAKLGVLQYDGPADFARMPVAFVTVTGTAYLRNLGQLERQKQFTTTSWEGQLRVCSTENSQCRMTARRYLIAAERVRGNDGYVASTTVLFGCDFHLCLRLGLGAPLTIFNLCCCLFAFLNFSVPSPLFLSLSELYMLDT